MSASEPAPSDALSRPRWIAAALWTAAALALLCVAWIAFEDRLIAEALVRYDAPDWRRDLLRVRLENYGPFFGFAAGVAAAFAAALRFGGRPRAEAALPAGAGSSGRAALAAAVGALAIGVGLVAMYALSTAEWERFGRPCWDGYCDYANRFRAVIFREDPGAADRLLAFIRGNYHSNSPAGPVLTALVSGVTGLRTVTAYRVVVGAATLTSLALVWLALLPRIPVSRAARAGALALLGTHLVVIRSAFFPQTDALVLLWTTAALALVWARFAQPRGWHGPAIFALMWSGAFVKLSFLPALALVPLWDAAVWRWPRLGARRETLARVVSDGVVYALIPAALYAAFQSWIGSAERFATELSRTSTEDTLWVFAAMSLLQAALAPGALAALARRRFEPIDGFCLLWVGLYLVSLWASGASGWNRFYLPIVPALAVVAARGLQRIRESFGDGAMWSAVAACAAANYAALALQLYY